MQHTKIEWVRNSDDSPGYSWNPIKGICPMNCKTLDGKEYCYARKIYKRFKLNPELRFDVEGFYKLSNLKKPSGIFLYSTIEIFHPDISNKFPKWRDNVFNAIEQSPKHRFYILTKLPQNIDRPMPENVWLGTTITSSKEMINLSYIKNCEAKIKFVSIEPWFIFNTIHIEEIVHSVNWVIAGRLGGFGTHYDPPEFILKDLIDIAKAIYKPVFLKDNLIPILGKDFVMENRQFAKEEK